MLACLLASHGEREKRVIDNKGHNTLSFASQIAGEKVAKKWHILDFSDGGIQFLRKFLVYYTEETHFGLISGFHTLPPFKEAAELNKRKVEEGELGCWLFDGEGADTKGEWISFEEFRRNNEQLRQYERTLRDDLEKQEEQASILEKETKKKFEAAFEKEAASDDGDEKLRAFFCKSATSYNRHQKPGTSFSESFSRYGGACS